MSQFWQMLASIISKYPVFVKECEENMRTVQSPHLGQSIGLALVLLLMSAGVILLMTFESGLL